MRKRRYIPDLIEAMADCDANYIRLMKLFGCNESAEVVAMGIPGAGTSEIVLELRVEERCPYTTMVSLQVSAEQQSPWLRWPAMEIRIYHDVKSAEVVSVAEHKRLAYRYDYPNPAMYQPDEKCQVNRYLGELLSFCLRHGHALAHQATDQLYASGPGR